jgi:hypothetical protein
MWIFLVFIFSPSEFFEHFESFEKQPEQRSSEVMDTTRTSFTRKRVRGRHRVFGVISPRTRATRDGFLCSTGLIRRALLISFFMLRCLRRLTLPCLLRFNPWMLAQVKPLDTRLVKRFQPLTSPPPFSHHSANKANETMRLKQKELLEVRLVLRFWKLREFRNFFFSSFAVSRKPRFPKLARLF